MTGATGHKVSSKIEADDARRAHVRILPALRLQLQPGRGKRKGEQNARPSSDFGLGRWQSAASPVAARARAPNPPACRRLRYRIWCGSHAYPSPPFRRTASASPTPCAPPTWTPTRDAPPSGCSTSASATPRPMRLTDLAANSSAPEWSGDGRFLYYLSNRSGSMQVWRLSPGNARRAIRPRSRSCRSRSARSACLRRATACW